MIPRLIPILALGALCGALGCVGAGEAPEDIEPKVSRTVLQTPRAVYVKAESRMHAERAKEIDKDIQEQRQLLRELVMRRQEVLIDAKYERHYETGLESIREGRARSLEAEAHFLNLEIERRRTVLSTLEDRASWHRRESAKAERLTANILRHPEPVDTPFRATERVRRGGVPFEAD